jgi:two-component system, NtrC family, response regulator
MILVIDDDFSVTASLGLLLKQAGHEHLSAASPGEALQKLENPDIELVLQDMNFSRRTSGEEGLELLKAIRAARPDLPVILITAWGSISLAVEGMKAGAADFITKPWKNEQILSSVETILGLAATGHTSPGKRVPSREELDERWDFQGIIGRDPKLLEILNLIGRVAPTDASILITGESGTGKELLADAIHRNSRRAAGPFVKVNLAGIPAGLFETEMFGHVRGAYTDAHRDREGRFATANRGTIFLDEIGDLDAGCQVKLLRVLQDRTYEVVGESRPRTVDVRIVSATNRDLTRAMAAGNFREDLYYRLNLITIHLPSLEERRDDVPLLAGHFLAQASAAHGRPGMTLTEPARLWLRNRPWPGNIRQLRHLIERTVLVSTEERLDIHHFRETLKDAPARAETGALPPVGAMTMDEIERAMILKSLEHHGGNIRRAAESLGMSRPALYRRIEKYGIPT